MDRELREKFLRFFGFPMENLHSATLTIYMDADEIHAECIYKTEVTMPDGEKQDAWRHEKFTIKDE